MEKPAETDHPVHELIQRRWSPRTFSDEPIGDETLRSLFEAARWAPSCYNDQPWHFIVGSKRHHSDTYADLYDCLVEGNQTWAETAPVLALSVARTRFEHNGKENKHALHDVGLAAENLVLEALSRGIFVHQMAGFSEDKARKTFDIPENHEPVAAFAMGYPGSPDSLPEELQKKEESDRSRKPLDEFVFTGKWDSTPSFL
ncbi:MAG: nitroreductase family protein [bacterium]